MHRHQTEWQPINPHWIKWRKKNGHKAKQHAPNSIEAKKGTRGIVKFRFPGEGSR